MRFIYELVDGGLPPKEPEPGDAGYDVFARLGAGLKMNGRPIAEHDARDLTSVALGAHSTVTIPLGFRAAIPEGYHADLRPRSGWSSKGVHVALGLIDEGYRGEWAAIVTNLGTTPITIEQGAKIAQVVFVETVLPEVIEGEVSTDTRRGEGGFGSTGFGVTVAEAVGWTEEHMVGDVMCASRVASDVAMAMKPDDGCTIDSSQGFHIGEGAYHDRHGQGWISRFISGGDAAIVIFLSAGTRAVDVRHLRLPSFGTKIPKPHIAFAMALQSQRQVMGIGLGDMPTGALDVERGRLPFDDAGTALETWLTLIKVNTPDRPEWHRRADMARREWAKGLDHDRDNCDGIQPEKCINAPALTTGDLVWWSEEKKVGNFRRYAEGGDRAKVECYDGEGWRFVPLADLTQPPPGRLMRLIRKAAGKTMGETARLMGVGVARLSGWEMCQTEPPAGDDLVAWLRAIEPVSDEWSDAVVAYINSRRDQWSSPESRPFAADTMRPDVSLPGEDPKWAEARARWMAAHHHGAGYHEWNESHPAPIEALRAYINDENGGPLGYSDVHSLLGEIEWLRSAVRIATGEAEGRALAEVPVLSGFAGTDRMMKAIRALRVDRDSLQASERAADAEIERLRDEAERCGWGVLHSSLMLAAETVLGERLPADFDPQDVGNAIVERWQGVATAIGHDEDDDGSIFDRAAELMQGSLDLEAAFDAVALSVDAAQGEDEAHIDYVRRVVESVRELRGHRDMLDRGVYVASEEIDGIRAERDTLRARYADHCEALDSIAAVTVDDAFDDGTGQVPPKDAAAVIVAHIERLKSSATDTALHAAVRRLFSRLHAAPAAGETIVDTLDRIGSSLGPVADMSGVVPEVEPGAWLVNGGGLYEAEGEGYFDGVWRYTADSLLRLAPGEPIDGPFWILTPPTPDAPLARKVDIRPPAGAPAADKPPRRPMLMLGPVQPHAHLRVEARAKAALTEKVERERQKAVIPAPDGDRWLSVWRRNGQTLDMEPRDGGWWHRSWGWTATPGEMVIRHEDDEEGEAIVAWQWCDS